MAINEQSNENRSGDWISKVPLVIAAVMVVLIFLTYKNSKQSSDSFAWVES